VRCAAAKTCGHCLPRSTTTTTCTTASAIPTRYIGLRAVEEAHQWLSQLARVSPAAAEAYRLGLLETAAGAGAGAAAALRYVMMLSCWHTVRIVMRHTHIGGVVVCSSM
jgi:hypothetical protein